MPVSASAAVDRVTFSATGSTFSAIPVTVSKRVWNSVVTVETVITSPGSTRATDGVSGAVKASTLLPKIVVPSTSAMTLAGMSCK